MMITQAGSINTHRTGLGPTSGGGRDSQPPEPPSPHGSDYSVDMSDCSMVGRDELVGEMSDFTGTSRVPIPDALSGNMTGVGCFQDSSIAVTVGEEDTEVVQESMVALIEGEDISNSPLSNVLLEDDDDVTSTENPLQQSPIINRTNREENVSSYLCATMLMTTDQDERASLAEVNLEMVKSTLANKNLPITSFASTIEDEESDKCSNLAFEELSDGGESVLTGGEEGGTPVEDEPDNDVTSVSPPSMRAGSDNQKAFSRGSDEKCAETRTDFRGLFPVGNTVTSRKHASLEPDGAHEATAPSPYTGGNNTADDSRMMIDENTAMEEDDMEMVSDEELNVVEGEIDTVGDATPTADEPVQQRNTLGRADRCNTMETQGSECHGTANYLLNRTQNANDVTQGDFRCAQDTQVGANMRLPVMTKSTAALGNDLCDTDGPCLFIPTQLCQPLSKSDDLKSMEPIGTTPLRQPSPQHSKENIQLEAGFDCGAGQAHEVIVQSRLAGNFSRAIEEPLEGFLSTTSPSAMASETTEGCEFEVGLRSEQLSPELQHEQISVNEDCPSRSDLRLGDEKVLSEESIGVEIDLIEDNGTPQAITQPSASLVVENTCPSETSSPDSAG
ncbi:hypothetical protein BIW11_07483 [Tropilaelaps mercedesae]|uniref:Uncharacterized protein n=1 Tax=Tropilaelaps mercedesae TaxID=418985 RepID=A0A1V9XTS6_9ACAR|nr:hypothetical protein BIW11_07483 [Tropilaelaps mercedesae]